MKGSLTYTLSNKLIIESLLDKFFKSSLFELLNIKMLTLTLLTLCLSDTMFNSLGISKRKHLKQELSTALLSGNFPETPTRSVVFVDKEEENDKEKYTPVLNNPIANRNVSSADNTFVKRPKSTKAVGKTNTVSANTYFDLSQNEFNADLKEGVIGFDSENGFDSPQDNVFNLNINQPLLESHDYFLSYEVYGVQSMDAVSRSINDHASIGGYMIKKTNTWSNVKELLNVKSLNVGFNSLKFNTIPGSKYHYKIKNLKISKQPKVESNTNNKTEIKFTKNNTIYVRGIKPSIDARIFINEEELITQNLEFEKLHLLSETDKLNGFIEIKTIAKDGTSKNEMLWLSPTLIEADYFE